MPLSRSKQSPSRSLFRRQDDLPSKVQHLNVFNRWYGRVPTGKPGLFILANCQAKTGNSQPDNCCPA